MPARQELFVSVEADELVIGLDGHPFGCDSNCRCRFLKLLCS